MPKQTVKNGLRVEKIKLPQINFFWKNNQWNCHVPISPFHYPKFKKSSWGWSRVMRMCHFWAQNGPFVMNKSFWYKPLLLLSSTYWPFFIVQNFKKLLQQIQSYEDALFLGPKFSICPIYIYIYFWKIIKIILICLLAPFDDDRSGRGRDSFRMSQRDIGENCYMTG